jgi:ferritin-like metal-binding protein YciE
LEFAIMTDSFRALFDELHAAEDQVETALQAVVVADAASRKVRAAIWAAIDRAMDAHNDTHDRIARLETLVLELTNRLPPSNGGAS